MKSIWFFVVFFGAMILFGTSLAGQEILEPNSPNKPATSKKADDNSKAEAQQQLLIHISDVLRVTAEDANKWKDAAVAARTQVKISNLLWDSDSDAGRYYLVHAWETTARIEEEKQERSRFRNESARNDARRDVLLVARRRAPDLAKKWLEQIAQEAEDERNTRTRGAFDDRTAHSTVLLQMALQTVDDNPQAAAEMAMASLQDGVSFGFQQVLLKLQAKNFDVAQSVFRAALRRLRVSGLVDPNELLILYSYLYTPGQINVATSTDNGGIHQIAVGRDRPRVVPAAQLNPALALEFLNLAADLLLALPAPEVTADPQFSARAQLSVIGYLLAEMLRVLPERAVALQVRAQQIDPRFSTEPSSSRSDIPTPRDGESPGDYAERRVDALEAAAEKARTSLDRDIAYAKAALATTVQHYERGLKLAAKVEDESLQKGVANWLIYRATLHLISAGDFGAAYKVNLQSTEPLQRSVCLISGAQKSVKEKDLIRARQWLEEARSLVKKAEQDDHRSRVAFGIVSSYGQFDKVMAFQSLSEAVHLTSQASAIAKVDERAPLAKRFSGLGTLPDFTYGTTGFNLTEAIKVFDAEQFDQVLSVINEIPSPEARGMGVVILCEQHLQALRMKDKKSLASSDTSPKKQ